MGDQAADYFSAARNLQFSVGGCNRESYFAQQVATPCGWPV
jgi:hypothetical protein